MVPRGVHPSAFSCPCAGAVFVSFGGGSRPPVSRVGARSTRHRSMPSSSWRHGGLGSGGGSCLSVGRMHGSSFVVVEVVKDLKDVKDVWREVGCIVFEVSKLDIPFLQGAHRSSFMPFRVVHYFLSCDHCFLVFWLSYDPFFLCVGAWWSDVPLLFLRCRNRLIAFVVSWSASCIG